MVDLYATGLDPVLRDRDRPNWIDERLCHDGAMTVSVEVRDLVAHAVTNLRALPSGVGGGDFFASFGDPVEGDIAAAWAQQRAGADAPTRLLAFSGRKTH